ncbi:MFS transporter [Streptomyces sp. NBC_00063]|uniref:MFS transporter n=1 Tax=Streptomyces sp. NBC_00063 TaxID=2975638 RepID=UPI003D7564FE
MDQQATPSTNEISAIDAAEIAARVDRVPVGRFHVRLAVTLGTVTFFDSFDILSVAVVLSLITNTLGFGLTEAGLIISAGYLGQWIGMLLVGVLADSLGRRRAFIFASALFGAMSLLCAFAWDQTTLLVFRAVQGLGLGAEVPIAAILLSEYLGRRNRGRISVLYQSVLTWGIFFAPLVALLCTSSFGPDLGWRILLAVGSLPLLVAVWSWFSLPESARWLAVKGRVSEADKYVRAMEEHARARGVTLQTPEVKPLAAGESGKFRMREIFSPAYRRRTVMVALLWFTTFFMIVGCLSWLPTMYVKIGKLSHSQSLLLTLAMSGLQMVIVYVTAMLIDKVGRRPLLLLGLALAAAGALYGVMTIGVLGLATWQNLFVSGVIMTVGTTVPGVFLYLYTIELYPTRMRSWATSATASLGKLASIVSPSIFGFMLAGYGGPPAIFGALSIAAVVALAAVLIGGVETRGRSLEETSE